MGKKPHRHQNVVSLSERCRIELLVLANHAEAVNGLLYLAGAGWTEHNRVLPPNAPMPASIVGLAAMIYVPWTETNREHKITFVVEDHDGKPAVNAEGQPVLTAEGKLNVGRPPTISPGAGQHAPIAFNVPVTFPRAGSYRLVVRLNDTGDFRSWSFRVHDIPAQQVAGN